MSPSSSVSLSVRQSVAWSVWWMNCGKRLIGSVSFPSVYGHLGFMFRVRVRVRVSVRVKIKVTVSNSIFLRATAYML